MKKNLLIAGIAGFTILGGVASVNAISNTSSNSEPIVQKEERSSIITMEKAEEIAINKLGGKLKNIKLDDENGKPIYEIDLAFSGYEDIEVDIDALSGEVIEVEKELKKETKEKMKETNVKPQKSNENTIISEEKAISIALGDVNGKVIEVDFDEDDNEYEIEYITDNKKVEIKIHAQTGKILEEEYEYYHKK